MDSAAEIKRLMLATGNFQEQDLGFLSPMITLRILSATPCISCYSSHTAAQPHAFEGNRFFVANGNYNWVSGSTPADCACGQIVKYSRHAYAGVLPLTQL